MQLLVMQFSPFCHSFLYFLCVIVQMPGLLQVLRLFAMLSRHSAVTRSVSISRSVRCRNFANPPSYDAALGRRVPVHLCVVGVYKC
jgi:hypothetical protein